MELSDRIIVLLEGEIMGEVARADFDVHTVGLLMSGGRAEGHDEVATSQGRGFFGLPASQVTRAGYTDDAGDAKSAMLSATEAPAMKASIAPR